ncbi:nascent polypeptide-associated complex subunit alpha, muscle-specific form-like isoform X2 [Heliangelus exortis]
MTDGESREPLPRPAEVRVPIAAPPRRPPEQPPEDAGSGSGSGPGSSPGRDPPPDLASEEEEEQVPYPALAPTAFFCLKQTTRPRSWCLRLVCNPYPFPEGHRILRAIGTPPHPPSSGAHPSPSPVPRPESRPPARSIPSGLCIPRVTAFSSAGGFHEASPTPLPSPPCAVLTSKTSGRGIWSFTGTGQAGSTPQYAQSWGDTHTLRSPLAVPASPRCPVWAQGVRTRSPGRMLSSPSAPTEGENPLNFTSLAVGRGKAKFKGNLVFFFEAVGCFSREVTPWCLCKRDGSACELPRCGGMERVGVGSGKAHASCPENSPLLLFLCNLRQGRRRIVKPINLFLCSLPTLLVLNEKRKKKKKKKRQCQL